MADGTPWKHDLSHDSTISLWVAGAVMNMARLPIFWLHKMHNQPIEMFQDQEFDG